MSEAWRTIFITGVGRGLGNELARQLLDAGHRVFGSTRSSPCELDLQGLHTIDLSDANTILAGAADVAELTGHLDVLINCAGVDARAFGAADSERGPFDLDAETINSVFNVNVTGPMILTAALLPLLREGDDALVLNISSQLGSMEAAAEIGRDTAYCVSKAALNMYSVKAAAALRTDGIAVVSLHPGWVQTDMGGSSATLTATESASAIVDTMAQLSLEDSGRFINWDGSDHPW